MKSLSLLQQVSFTWFNPVYDVGESWPKLPECPNVRVAKTVGGPVMTAYAPLGHVRDLQIAYTPTAHILEALKQTATSLLICTIKFHDCSWDEQPWPPAGTMRIRTNTRFLNLEAYDIKTVPYIRFFNWVSAPFLHRLEIKAPNTWDTWEESDNESVEYSGHFGAQFIGFLHCSARYLTTIRLIGDLKISEGRLLDALAVTPALRCLLYHEKLPAEDNCSFLSNHFFNKLNLNHSLSTAAPFNRTLPSLMNLDLQFTSEDVEHRVILGMIKSRWMLSSIESDVIPLQRVHIVLTDRELDSEESSTMCRLQESGLRVRIVGPPPAAAGVSSATQAD